MSEAGTGSLIIKSEMRANDPDSVSVRVRHIDVRYGQRIFRESGSTGLLGGIAGACFFGPIGALAGWGLTSRSGSESVNTVPVSAIIRFENGYGDWVGYTVNPIPDSMIEWFSQVRKGDYYRIGRLSRFFLDIGKLAVHITEGKARSG